MPMTLMALFSSRQAVLDTLEELSQFRLLDIQKAAIIAKAASGKLVMVDNKLKPSQARKWGMGVGALLTCLGVIRLGAFALPGIAPVLAIGIAVILGTVLGGAIGQYAALLLRLGFLRDQLKTIAASLRVGEIALLLQVAERDQVPEVQAKLDELGVAFLESEAVTSSVFTQLRAKLAQKAQEAEKAAKRVYALVK